MFQNIAVMNKTRTGREMAVVEVIVLATAVATDLVVLLSHNEAAHFRPKRQLFIERELAAMHLFDRSVEKVRKPFSCVIEVLVLAPLCNRNNRGPWAACTVSSS